MVCAVYYVDIIETAHFSAIMIHKVRKHSTA